MRARLLTYGASAAVPTPPATGDAAERLAALGYVGGELFAGAPSGADPKDKIGEFEAYQHDMREALRRYGAADLDGSIRLLTRLARGGGVSFNVEYYLGRSLLEKGHPAEAVLPLEKAVALAPTAALARVHLARAYAESGRVAEALAAVERGLRAAPDNAELKLAEGSLRRRQGELPAARAALEKARALDGGDARVRVELAHLLRNLGDLTGARAEANEAVRLDPRSPDARVALGLVLGAQGQEGPAADSFRRALSVQADHAEALFYLASVELRAGRAAEAVSLLEKLLKKAPGYPEAPSTLALAREQLALPPAGFVRLRLLRVRDRGRAEELERRAAGAEDFAALARQFSEDPSASRGGDLGVMRPSDLAEPLRTAAAALAPGQVSALLETAQGYVLIKRER
jgi:tetratricopeptide (TPR) repeat protein